MLVIIPISGSSQSSGTAPEQIRFWVNGTNLENLNNHDKIIGTTIYEVYYLGIEFLKIDSSMIQLMNDSIENNDSSFYKSHNVWLEYRDLSCARAYKAENNLGKIDYINQAITVTRGRITSIKELLNN